MLRSASGAVSTESCREPGVAGGERAFDTGRVGLAGELPQPRPSGHRPGHRPQVDTDLATLAGRVRPVALAQHQVLPVLEPLESLLPGSGLQRGSVVGVDGPGATSLALALAAGPSTAGSWTVALALSTLGMAAAAEIGIDLARLAVVRRPDPERWTEVMAALIGACDLVLARPPRRVRPGDARRLQARARERGTTILLVVGGRAAGGPPSWPEGPDLRLSVTGTTWEGLGPGHGHLRARRIHVEAGGRRAAARSRRGDLWLLDPDGRVADAAQGSTVHVLAGG